MKNLTYFKQYGEMRSGTNYLKILIENNIQDTFVLASVFGWKHGYPVNHEEWLIKSDKKEHILSVDGKNPLPSTFSREILDTALKKGLIYIISVKNPYASFLSVMRFKKHKYWSLDNVKKWCNQYNKKHQSWFNLAKDFNGIIIRFEDLLVNAENEINIIAEKYNLVRSNTFKNINKQVLPSSDWNVRLANQNFDTSYYINQEYMKDIDKNYKECIRDNIDWNIFKKCQYKR